MKKTIRIGNAGGYWGDDPSALRRQVEGGHLDYITMDFLAEVTMSILQKQKAKDPSLGYARDFIPMLAGVLPRLLANKTCLITNAGGINPTACAAAIKKVAKEQNLNPKIAVVYGDDILPDIEDLELRGCKFGNMETGEDFSQVKNRLEAANVYFGAAPVVEALKKWNPDIIITGRVTDTGITVAPMIFEFAWALDDWDKIASGVIAGHLLECGSQATGGNFSDWKKVSSYDDIGYPIAEVSADASFVLTKHPGSGGLVSKDTVREQLFYEMGNPRAYLTPDVVADFTSIRLEDLGSDRVHVDSIRGYEPTPFYKVSMAYQDGHKCVGSILLSGPSAKEKAECFSKIFWRRLQAPYSDTLTEYVGLNACHRSLANYQDSNEIVLRLGARSMQSEDLRTFAKMIPSLILGGPPGVAVLGGVPKVHDLVSYWPALMPKTAVNPKIALFESELSEVCDVRLTKTGLFEAPSADDDAAESVSETIVEIQTQQLGHDLYSLHELCLARSGDKGDSVNIGVLARSPESFEFLKGFLSAQKVKNIFQDLCLGPVTRYCLKNMLGLNFLLEQSLGGGGSCTLRADAQGKTFSQAVLNLRVRVPQNVIDSCRQEGVQL